jgi:RNA polymerase sigma-70 factor (ECF subfamily)
MPHLGAAYNLARWILRSEQDAQDVVHDAILRACRFFEGFRGTNPRAWLLAIVRNSAWSFLEKKRGGELDRNVEEESDVTEDATAETPEVLLLRSATQRLLNEAVEGLPPEFREVVVLREVEGLSYKEIAEVAAIPIGTVMSRLSRARRQLQATIARREQAGGRS